MCIKLIAAWFVPDVPQAVKNKVLEEKYQRLREKLWYWGGAGRGGAGTRPGVGLAADPHPSHSCLQLPPQEHRRVEDPELVKRGWSPGAETQSHCHQLPPQPWLHMCVAVGVGCKKAPCIWAPAGPWFGMS